VTTKHDHPILVTGAAGAVGGIGRNLIGEAPMNMRDFVKLHAAEFKQDEPAHFLRRS
jgi:hypothetical protein